MSSEALATLVLLFFRSLGCIALLPLAKRSYAIGVRLGLVFSLSVFSFSMPILRVDSFSIYQCIFEVVLGMIVSLPLKMIVQMLELLGELIDVGRGQSIASFYDPTVSRVSTQTGSLLRAYGLSYLALTGALQLIFGTFFLSLCLAPLGGSSIVALLASTPELGSWIVSSLLHFMSAALPILLLFLMVDLAIGVMSKGATQGMLHSEGFVLKTILGFALLAGAVLQFNLPSNWDSVLRSTPISEQFWRGFGG